MINEIQSYMLGYFVNPDVTGKPPAAFATSIGQAVRRFHETLPRYRPTPLARLAGLARAWAVGTIMVKDESSRFDLSAFKVLGSSYAIARLLGKTLGLQEREIDFGKLAGGAARRRAGEMVFTTATDGNHGRGVAWTAEQLGQRSVVYMPKGTVEARIASIRSHGATVRVTDQNYDDTVRMVNATARTNGWHVIQDTALKDYTDIPLWIMQGYLTMCQEAIEQMADAGHTPTHVFIQAGVGSLAAAVVGLLRNHYADRPPRFILMEPNAAACFLMSAAAGDGHPRSVSGNLETIMAGLACGEPNPMAWDILKDLTDAYIRCDNYVAANGIRILANPVAGDPAIESGESGAVGIGLLDLIANHSALEPLKSALGIDGDAALLFFNTEGITDPVNVRRILWHGRYPLPLADTQ